MTPMSDEEITRFEKLIQTNPLAVGPIQIGLFLAEIRRLRAEPLRAEVEALRGALEKATLDWRELLELLRALKTPNPFNDGINLAWLHLRQAEDALAASTQPPEAPEEWEYRLVHKDSGPTQLRPGEKPQDWADTFPHHYYVERRHPGPWQRRNPQGEWQ